MIRANIHAEPVDAKVHIEVEGKDGQTPHIGEDGNWYIGENNTGMPSRGEKGNPGYSPEINVTDVPGGHAISIKGADGITHVVNVKDGLDGKDGKNATIEHRWDGSKLFITSSSGMSYADLQGPKGDKGDPGTSKPWLIGSTDEITPNDVMTALASERNVLLTHSTEESRRIAFSYFMASADGDFIVTSCPVVLGDEVAVFQLTGIISDNAWSFTISPMSGFGGLDKVDQVAMDVDKLKADVSDLEEDVVNLTEEIAEQTVALDGMTIEGYSRTGAFISVIDSAEKHENAYLRKSYVSGIGYSTAESVANGWNWYELPVTEGETYHLLTFCGMQPAAVYMLNANRKLVQMIPDPVPSEGFNFDEEFTIPAGVTILQVNQQYADKQFAFEKMSTYGFGFTRDNDYAKSSDSLYGKKLACVGDSITEATNPEGGYFKNYAEIVANRHGMTVYKDGKGGSTMANGEGRLPFCVDRYLQVPADFDILTIWFGWNDAAYSQIGTIEDTEDTTYYGAYKKVLEYFITTYPTKKIGLIVPYGNASVEPFRVAVRALSEMYGVPCLDLTDGKQCSLLWGTANAAQEARRAALTYDSTHPNQGGHEYLSTMYEEFIKRL